MEPYLHDRHSSPVLQTPEKASALSMPAVPVGRHNQSLNTWPNHVCTRVSRFANRERAKIHFTT